MVAGLQYCLYFESLVIIDVIRYYPWTVVCTAGGTGWYVMNTHKVFRWLNSPFKNSIRLSYFNFNIKVAIQLQNGELHCLL